jgi:predicted ribosome quality control (RQC) complex YloA/Tae2 family protein
VVGRTQKENEALEAWRPPGDPLLKVEGYPGPLVLVFGAAAPGDLDQAAGLAAAYSDAPTGARVRVSVQRAGPEVFKHLQVPPKDRFKEMLI